MEIELLPIEPAALAARFGVSTSSLRTAHATPIDMPSISGLRVVRLDAEDRAAAIELLAGLLDLEAPAFAGAPVTESEGGAT